MIRGYFGGHPLRLRPYIIAHVSIPSIPAARDIHFLVDSGADFTLLSPRDALLSGINSDTLPPGPPTTGVGGPSTVVLADARLTVGAFTYPLQLRILAPRSRAHRRALAAIPSLLGRDILAHFALVMEERTGRMLLLTPDEADALSLP